MHKKMQIHVHQTKKISSFYSVSPKYLTLYQAFDGYLDGHWLGTVIINPLKKTIYFHDPPRSHAFALVSPSLNIFATIDAIAITRGMINIPTNNVKL